MRSNLEKQNGSGVKVILRIHDMYKKAPLVDNGYKWRRIWARRA